MKILVIDAAGFLGMHVAQLLMSRAVHDSPCGGR